MRFRIRFAEQVAGAFVIIAFGLLATILILMGINQRWFAKDFEYTSTFKTGTSLNVGMPITLKGFQIGAVDAVSLSEINQVDIRFHVFDTYIEKVTENSVLELAVSPIGLGGGLVFHPGKKPEGRDQARLLPENTFIPSTDFDEAKKMIAAGLVDKPEGEDTITRLIQDVEPILTNVNDTLTSLSALLDTADGALSGSGEGPIGELIAEVVLLIGSVESTVTSTTSEINRVLSSLDAIAVNLEKTSELLSDPEGIVQTLLDPTGSIDTILNDDNALFHRIESILAGIEGTVSEVEGFVDYLNATSPEISVILEDGRQVIGEAEDVIESISNNPLIRGGIPEQQDQPTTFQSYRDEDF